MQFHTSSKSSFWVAEAGDKTLARNCDLNLKALRHPPTLGENMKTATAFTLALATLLSCGTAFVPPLSSVRVGVVPQQHHQQDQQHHQQLMHNVRSRVASKQQAVQSTVEDLMPDSQTLSEVSFGYIALMQDLDCTLSAVCTHLTSRIQHSVDTIMMT